MLKKQHIIQRGGGAIVNLYKQFIICLEIKILIYCSMQFGFLWKVATKF